MVLQDVFGLTVLKFDDFFEWNPATQTRGEWWDTSGLADICR